MRYPVVAALAVICVLAQSAVGGYSPAQGAEARGVLKVCKKGSFAADEREEYKRWVRQRVVIPSGTIFSDAGTIGSYSSKSIRLKIEVLRDVVLEGEKRCEAVPALIPPDDGKWWPHTVGPFVRRVEPSERRYLEVDGLVHVNKSDALREIEATVESAFK